MEIHQGLTFHHHGSTRFQQLETIKRRWITRFREIMENLACSRHRKLKICQKSCSNSPKWTHPSSWCHSTYINPYINMSCSSMIGRSSGQKKRSASSMTINWHWLLGMDEKPLNVKFGDLFCWSEQQQEEQWKVREKKECRISESSFHQKVLCKKCSLEECCLKRSYLFKGSDGPNRVYIYIYI